MIDLFDDLLPVEQYIGEMLCHSLRYNLRERKVTESFIKKEPPKRAALDIKKNWIDLFPVFRGGGLYHFCGLFRRSFPFPDANFLCPKRCSSGLYSGASPNSTGMGIL